MATATIVTATPWPIHARPFHLVNTASISGSMPMRESYGKWLRRQRQARDLTQEALQSISKVSQTYISDLERYADTPKEKEPSREKAIALAQALGIPVSEGLAAAGYSLTVDTEDPNELRLESGSRVRILARAGDPGKPLKVTPEVMAILEQLANLQDGS